MKKLFSLIILLSATIISTAQPVASFSFTPTGTICMGDTVYFTNLSSGYDSSRWNFGDFSPVDTATNSKHLYGWSAAFNVKLTVYNTGSGDSSVIIKSLYVTGVPATWYAMFNIAPASPVCFGTGITFTDFNFMFMPPSFVIWDFGDGDSSGLFTPTHNYAAPGTYSVVLTAGNACGSDADTVAVTVSANAPPPMPSFFVSPTPACPSTMVAFSNSSFPTPVSTVWTFGDGDSAFTLNTAHSYTALGTFTVSMTVDNGCNDTTIYKTVAVTNTIVPTVSATAGNDTVCINDTIAFAGGGTNLTSFLWNFGDGNTSLQQNPKHSYSSLGTYTVTFTGTNGCGNSANKTIVIRVLANAPPIANFSFTPFANCSGFSQICPGAVVYFTNATVNGVSWSWNFGDAGTSTAMNPTHSYTATGSYTVTLIAISSCGGTATIKKCLSVANNVIPSAFFCYGFGCIPGAVCPDTPVQFNNFSSDTTSVFWDFEDGNTSTLVNPSHPFADTGTYIVSVTVTNLCGNFATYSAGVHVTYGNVPSASLFYWPATACPGTTINFSSFSFSATDYYWDFGDGGIDSIQNAVHAYASSGTYTVTLIASNGCGGDTITQVIGISDGSTPDFTFASTCFGNTTSFTDASSPTPASWAWDLGDGNTSTLQNPTHTYTAIGTYQVILTVNLNGCVSSVTKNISITKINLSSSSTPATCIALGSAAVSASGGNNPYTYLWNPGGQTTSAATSLAPGNYSVTVTDVIGCTATTTATVGNVGAVVFSICSSTNVSCNGVCDGSASVCPAGGLAPYTYSWFPGGQTTTAFINLCAGNYTMTGTDANGCTDTAVAVITQPAPLTPSITVTNVSCNGMCDGSVTASASGGTPAYTYAWSSGCTLVSCTGLCAGTYTVIVTDANNCTAASTVSVTQPAVLGSGIAGTNISCNGAGDGSADLTVTGGTPPYTCIWNPGGATTEDVSALVSGSYTVDITDANGCTASGSVTITEPAVLAITIDSIRDVSCNGGSDGFIFTTAGGGTSPYTYSWNPSGQTSGDLSNVTAGVYTVTITDANGCTATVSDTINEPSAIAMLVDSTNNVTVCSGSDGAIYISASGGTGAYTYLWNPGGQTTEDITNIPSGPHTVIITDANGCMAFATVTITDPSAMIINVDSTFDVSCYGGSDGEIYISVVGGNPPLGYTWSNGNTTQDLSGLIAGSYTVIVTDAGGCSATGVFNVAEPSVLIDTASSVDASCISCCDGSASAAHSGGTSPYTYMWLPGGQTTASAIGLCVGTYTVCVTDANGCSVCDFVTVLFPIGISQYSILNTQYSIYPNPTSGVFNMQMSRFENVQMKIYNVYGECIYQQICTSAHQQIDLSSQSSGIYFLHLKTEQGIITKKIIINK
ncbi:MAG: PKD domain-containing protein [Bacteroidetes bacterium]|nr:PKD domain-containing protein [Bacteroidota bacterium]